MRIFHILNTLIMGDGVGNTTRAMNSILIEMGWRSCMYAKIIPYAVQETGIAQSIEHLPPINPDDVILYHYSIGWDIDPKIAQLPCKKIMIYHNVTSPHFFKPYNKSLYVLTTQGRKHLTILQNAFDYCLADSAYNKQELIDAGFTCPIDVLPIIVPFQDYEKTPDATVQQQYNDNRTNILFTGRVAPNKKHENIIAAFAAYKKNYNPTARLFLVGSCNEPAYLQDLHAYVQALQVEDVIFTGHVTFAEILAYYSLAHAFLCMSEHEGFCIPLLEAMYFDIPVFAYATTAVPYTMGNAGILLENNDPFLAAAAIHTVQTYPALRQQIIAGQQRRLEDFTYEKISAQFKQYFTNFMEREK